MRPGWWADVTFNMNMGIMNEMSKKEELENALKDAMRKGDDVRKRTLRMALSSIRMAELERGRSLEDGETLAILQKEMKSRLETISEAERANRPDLASSTRAEIPVLEIFLPQQLTQEELEEIARAAIAEAGATSPAEMGKVMKILIPRLQGRAPGDQTSQIVRQLLQQQSG
jgi:uncharacterized protein